MKDKAKCKKCNETGQVVLDTSEYGDCSGWNPGQATILCECTPMNPDMIKTLKEIGIDVD